MPPKKDVFADLFQSAAGTSLNLSLNSDLNLLNKLPTKGTLTPVANHVSLSSNASSGSLTAAFDEFSIFEKPVSQRAPPQKVSPEINLLDDDFVDAFPKTAKLEVEQPPPIPQPHPLRTKGNENGPRKQVPKPETPPASRNERLGKDTVLAELVDMGFSVKVANDAIARCGCDLQKCVNYIMSAPSSRQTPSPEKRRLESPRWAEGDIGSTFTNISTDFLKKASLFLEKSKNTVLKNIGDMQDSSGLMPAWMESQAAHKKRHEYDDYGTDEENIRQAEIEKIIRAQRQRERERRRERLGGDGPEKPAKVPLGESPARENHIHSFSEPKADPKEKQVRPSSNGLVKPTENIPESAPTPVVPASPEVDLLGLSKATATPLSTIQQSDYETNKARGAEAYKSGDYGTAYEAYTRCMEALPAGHEFKVVVLSNLALSLGKLGNYKLARQHCDEGLQMLSREGSDWVVDGKESKYWRVKFLTRKAESLEMTENYPEALACYVELVGKYGANDKRNMDAKRRIGNIVNPPKPPPKPKATARDVEQNLKRERELKARHRRRQQEEEARADARDKVHEEVLAWSQGNEENLRNLLMALPDIFPGFAFPFVEKRLTINDLMLTKKVKIHYLKVISLIHPDKLGKMGTEEQVRCQEVFVVLNKAWDVFKTQNGMN